MSDVKIVIDASTNNIESTFNNVANSLNKLEAEAKQTNEALKESSNGLAAKWRDASVSLASTFSIINSGMDKLKKGMAMIGEGADLSEARLNFRAYAASINQDSDTIVAAVRKATKNQVSDADIMKSATRALRLGVTTDLTQLAKLYEIADAKGDMFGQSLEETFRQITDAIAKGNGKALIELGVLPEKFGKAGNAAELFKKQGELLNVVLAQSGRDMEALSPVGDTLSDKLNQLNAGIGNVGDSLKMMGADVFAPTVEWLNNSILPALKDSIDYWREWLGLLERSRDIYAKFGPAGEIAAKMESMSTLKNDLRDLIRLRAELENQKMHDDGAGMLSGLIEIRLGAVRSDIEQKKGELKGYEKEYKLLLDKIKNAKNEPPPTPNTVGGRTGDTNGVVDGIGDQLKKLRHEVEKTEQTIIDSFGVKTVKSFKDANHLLLNMTAAAGGFAVGLKNGTTEAGKMLEQIAKAEGKIAQFDENFQSMLRNRGYNSAADLRSLTPDAARMGMIDFMSGGLYTARGGTINDPVKDLKEPLSKTIADAVTAGFANADFSSLELTLGSILSSVLSKSVATSNPVVDAATGAVNWGNLGVNLAASYGAKLISGLFTTKEKNKEAIQQASNLEATISSAYLKTFESELLPYIAGESTAMGGYLKDQLYKARMGINGISVGYTYDKDWSWGDLSWQKEYQLNAPGASNALENLNYWNKAAEKYNEQQKRNLELMSAGGQSFKALAAQTEVYTKAAATAGYTYDNRTLSWTGYGDRAGINTKYETDLSDEIHELLITQTELARQLGAATAERSTNAAAGFARYAPWLENIYMPNQYSQQSSTGNGIFSPVVRGIPLPGFNGYSASVEGLSRDQYYDAFEKLQNDYADRNISTGLLDIVKESGSGRYELEKLRVTGSEDYAEAYADYLDKQISAIEEVMERQEEIFKDATRTFEERSAALANYEAAQDSYYQAKLDSLAAEQAAEAAIKQKQQEADLRKAEGMEAALSLVGEVAQRGDKIVILQGGDSTAALKTLLEKFQDDPSVAAILTAAISENESKARWGN
jgi:hypothetical protein